MLLKRADDGKWQGVSGGGEDNETFKNAAIRETFEETGDSGLEELIKLDTISYIKKQSSNVRIIRKMRIYMSSQCIIMVLNMMVRLNYHMNILSIVGCHMKMHKIFYIGMDKKLHYGN